MKVATNGVELETETFGDPAHPALLLIMGLGCQMLVWPRALCEQLAAAGFYVVRFDNRDVGLSTQLDHLGTPKLMREIVRQRIGLRARAPYRLHDMVKDTVGLMDALKLPRAHVVGLSMGGMIAQLMALQHPERVQGLTLVMTSSNNPRLPQPTLGMQLRLIKRPRGFDRRSLIEHGIRTWQLLASPRNVPTQQELEPFVTSLVERAITPRGYVRQLLAVLASGPRHRQLGAIRQPTLVIHGLDDPLIPKAAGEELARLIPGAELMLVPNMGHDLPANIWPQLLPHIVRHAKGQDLLKAA